MRNRRIVCFLMGIWVGVSAMLAFNVYSNFARIDVILKSPPEQTEKILRILGPDNARILLRYTAGVENWSTFVIWEDIQLGLGLTIMIVMFVSSSTRILSIVPLLMTLLLLFLHLKITPDLAWLGRSLYTSMGGESGARESFWKLHRIYEVLEAVKCLLGLGLAVFLILQSRERVVRRKRHESASEAAFNRHAASR